MEYPFNRIVLLLLIICIGAGCANIVPPVGGKKDIKPPILVQAAPPDSQLNIKPKRIELHFDEYITVNDANKEVSISPILPINPTVLGVLKKVTVKIVDSLLEPNTTYRISFGSAIRDLHEGNVFKDYTYTFSTGSYFDSLELKGRVINAMTGLPDSGTVKLLLYNAKESDSAIVRKKPMYVVMADKNGYFTFKGLPGRNFNIYALKDFNNNLTYDGEGEWIGFIDRTVFPGDTTIAPIQLRIFKEVPDTSRNKTADTSGKKLLAVVAGKVSKTTPAFDYIVAIDTGDVRRRTKEINKPVTVLFNREIASINHERISLSYDSEGVIIPVKFSVKVDSFKKDTLYVNADWKENSSYVLKLLKGFAKDTSGADAMPSKYVFTTKMDDDYGKLNIHLSKKYVSKDYVLLVKTDRDTVYKQSAADTLVPLTLLQPADYTILIIIDSNHNGRWDTGDLFKKIQPEEVIPYGTPVTIKAGWENTIDIPDSSKNPPPSDQKNAPNQKPK